MKGNGLSLRLGSVALGAFAILVLYAFAWPFLVGPQSQRSLLTLYSTIKLGDRTRDVQRDFDSLHDPNLQLFGGESDSLIRITTPTTIGANNWSLIVMIEDDCVAGFGIRTEDSQKIKPTDAPNDVAITARLSAWKDKCGPLRPQ